MQNGGAIDGWLSTNIMDWTAYWGACMEGAGGIFRSTFI
jgi:hypothetical protein